MNYGYNFSSFSADIVRFGEELEDNDIITDDEGHRLIYRKDDDTFVLFTNDPNESISDEDLSNNWRKI
jgi:hypothetical protein